MDLDHPFAMPVAPNRTHPISVEGLLDAASMRKKHPATFEVPPQKELQGIKPGDIVKVSRNGERFWVTVTGFEKRRIHGQVSNELERNHDLPFGETIFFQKKNVMSYVPKRCVTY